MITDEQTSILEFYKSLKVGDIVEMKTAYGTWQAKVIGLRLRKGTIPLIKTRWITGDYIGGVAENNAGHFTKVAL